MLSDAADPALPVQQASMAIKFILPVDYISLPELLRVLAYQSETGTEYEQESLGRVVAMTYLGLVLVRSVEYGFKAGVMSPNRDSLGVFLFSLASWLASNGLLRIRYLSMAGAGTLRCSRCS